MLKRIEKWKQGFVLQEPNKKIPERCESQGLIMKATGTQGFLQEAQMHLSLQIKLRPEIVSMWI